MELLLNFIDFQVIGFGMAGGFGASIGAIERSKKENKTRKSIAVSEILQKKNLKIIFPWIIFGLILGIQVGIVKGMFEASVQVYSNNQANLSEWLVHSISVGFILGLAIINYYLFPNQEDIKKLKSRVSELEKQSKKT